MLNNVGILHYMVGAMIFEICSARDGSFKCFSSLFHLFHLNRNITWKCHCGAAITSDENKFNDRNVDKGESTLECCTKFDESFEFGDDLCRFDLLFITFSCWESYKFAPGNHFIYYCFSLLGATRGTHIQSST